MAAKSIRTHLFWLILLSGCVGIKSEPDFYSLELKTLEQETFSFSPLKSKQAVVIIFLQPECPFCNTYSTTFRRLDSTFAASGIPMLGVVAGKNYPVADIKTYHADNNFKFPILLDPDFILQKQLNAIITPEAFLVSNSAEVLYRGLIDNWAYEIGKVRPVVTEHYLADAVTALLQHKPIQPDSTKAIGCYIE